MVLDKLPPHDIAAEEAVVAACLVDANALMGVAPILRADDFFREKNGWVFEASVNLSARNEPVNQITVAHELARAERLEKVGGMAYLSRLVSDLPTVVGVEYYAEIVARDSVYRKLITVAGRIAQNAYEGGHDLEGVLGRAEELLMGLRRGEAVRDFKHLKSLLDAYLDENIAEEDETAGPSVLRSGLIDLDTLLGGFKRSDLIIVAARPSMGKCLAAGTLLTLADGSVVTIEEIVHRERAEVFTLDHDGRLRTIRPTAFLANGVLPTVRLTTQLGRSLECTANHPFLTLDGWKPLDELHTGDCIAVPRQGQTGGVRGVGRQHTHHGAAVLALLSPAHSTVTDVAWDYIRAIEPAGQQPVYDLTIPDTHNFVANDIVVHNSALVMRFARNAAIGQKAKIAVFNLEMSAEQLAQRLLSSEADVDSTRLRLREATEAEERRKMHAIGRLAECDIYIDDSPVMTISELKSKCRRLQQEKGLDMLIIDYLQLMQGSDKGNENRVQEISFISRSLKNLARELNVPVIALSQLSRAVESRKPPIPMMSDLRESGCLTGDTLVALASGELARIDALVGTQPEVVTLDDWTVTTARASEVWHTGYQPVYRLKTRTGRSVRATANHPFRALPGWRSLEDLRPGDRIAIPRRYPEPPTPLRWAEDRLLLLAHLIGDGCYASRQPLHYTSASEANLAAVAAAASSAFGITAKRVPQGTWAHLYLTAGGNRWHPSPLQVWLRQLGTDGTRSYEKVIPSPIFALASDQIAFFLRHLWATDGCVHVRGATHGPIGTVYYASSSLVLAEQVQHLLQRLGIRSRIRTSYKGSYRPMYQVHVMGKTDQLHFAEVVGGHGERETQVARLAASLQRVTANTNADTIPVQIWSDVRERMRAAGISQRGMTALRGTAYGGTSHFKFAPSRSVLAQYASLLDAPPLTDLAHSDVYWDTIESIEPDGSANVYDMTVPGTHNFVANGIAVHNSIEQDADLVMFIYREAYYTQREDWESSNMDTPGRAYPNDIAQLIIAKHRNGPVGTVDVRFQQKTAKFEDLYAREEGR